MYNPRDFLPAKYKKTTQQIGNSVTDESSQVKIQTQEKDVHNDSPWSDLASEPQVPTYRNHLEPDRTNFTDQAEFDQKPAATQNQNLLEEVKKLGSNQTVNAPLKPKNQTAKKKSLVGALAIFFLIVGVFASYLLTKQSQDTRQQAASIVCHPTEDPYCDSSTGRCQDGYYLVLGFCISEDDYCGDRRHVIDGKCYHDTCRKLSNGTILCGYLTDGDPCTEESMGGDWCDNPNTAELESCGDAGLIRCLCGPEWWVIGKAASCDALCDDAGINCSDCETTPTPTNPPVNPSTTPTATPTPPAEPLSCGEFNCTQNADCETGLTCQAVTVDGQAKNICAKGENQLFCAADPTTASCCESQAMPVCANIEILDANNNLLSGDDDDDLSVDDQVRFRCAAEGNQNVEFDYQFRIWDKSTDVWENITDTSDTVAKNVSALYTIDNFGKYVVQGRICWGSECQVWETVDNAPSN
jgi:hypothetical protein